MLACLLLLSPSSPSPTHVAAASQQLVQQRRGLPLPARSPWPGLRVLLFVICARLVALVKVHLVVEALILHEASRLQQQQPMCAFTIFRTASTFCREIKLPA
jgi:hypothetical protein